MFPAPAVVAPQAQASPHMVPHGPPPPPPPSYDEDAAAQAQAAAATTSFITEPELSKRNHTVK